MRVLSDLLRPPPRSVADGLTGIPPLVQEVPRPSNGTRLRFYLKIGQTPPFFRQHLRPPPLPGRPVGCDQPTLTSGLHLPPSPPPYVDFPRGQAGPDVSRRQPLANPFAA